MKRFFTLLTALIIATAGMAQSYFYTPFLTPGQNPGGLNTDDEQPWAYLTANLSGYTQVLGQSFTPTWSTQQIIPIPFNFEGSSVAQYYVSSTGVLTFSSTPGTAPPETNTAIPSASIPDMSVMIWGVNLTGSNDAIVSKTFGTAPNRQHWVIWASASESGLVGSSNWVYWGLVFEETTNNIYIVDMRTYDSGGGNVSLTAGVQVDGSTAVQVAGSPNFQAVTTATGGSSSLTDNAYYRFVYGFPPNYDVALTSINVDGSMDPVQVSANNTVGGSIINYGAQTVTSFDVTYKIDGGAGVTHNVTGVSVPLGATYDFTHATAWNPSSGGGTFANVEVEVSNLNGNADENPGDNTLDADFFLNNGVTTTKHVLFEEYSTAPCGFCPDGLLVIEDMIATLTNVNFAQIHAGFGTDAMTIPEHTQWAAAFTNAAPTAQVDRVHFEGEDYVAISRSLWKQRTQDQLNEGVPVNIILEGDYDEGSRELSLNVKAEFKDYAVPGDYRLNVYIIEDPVVGTGAGYDQVNYYSSQHSSGGVGGPSHPFYNEPHPIVGYEHRFVIRAVPSTTWGNSGVIPQAPQPNETYEKSYTTTLDQSWDEPEIYVIAYVSRYDNDVKKRPVMNSYQEHLDAFKSTGIGAPKVEADIEIYPNPATDFAQVSLDLEKTSDVTVEVVNAIGQRHTAFAHSATYAAGKQYVTLPTHEWGAGVYMVNIRINGINMVKQLVVTR